MLYCRTAEWMRLVLIEYLFFTNASGIDMLRHDRFAVIGDKTHIRRIACYFSSPAAEMLYFRTAECTEANGCDRTSSFEPATPSDKAPAIDMFRHDRVAAIGDKTHAHVAQLVSFPHRQVKCCTAERLSG